MNIYWHCIKVTLLLLQHSILVLGSHYVGDLEYPTLEYENEK